MPDYYTPGQVALKLGLTESQIAVLLAQGLMQPVRKNGREFYSAHQVYQLKAAIKLARKRNVSLKEAMTHVSGRPLYQVEGAPR
jgi:DNA-binding transcriptional MerR regulator